MRSTVRIDDDLMEALKARAERDGTSLTRALNATLRSGLKASNEAPPKKRFAQRTASLGMMHVQGHKALALATALEDEETLAKLAARE